MSNTEIPSCSADILSVRPDREANHGKTRVSRRDRQQQCQDHLISGHKIQTRRQTANDAGAASGQVLRAFQSSSIHLLISCFRVLLWHLFPVQMHDTKFPSEFLPALLRDFPCDDARTDG